MLEIDEIIQRLDKTFAEESILTLREVKYFWIIAFGFKPSKAQILEKLPVQSYNKKSRIFERWKVYELLKEEAKFIDIDAREVGLLAIVDKTQKGFISFEDFHSIFKNTELTDDRATKIFDLIDTDRDLRISYSQFLRCVNFKKLF